MHYMVFSFNGLEIKFSIVWMIFFFFWVFVFFVLCFLDCEYHFDLNFVFTVYFIGIVLSSVVLAVVTGSLDIRLYLLSRGWLNALLC